jgi:hypothetical protein
MIGQKIASLKYLELSLRTMKAGDAVAELKRYLPGLRGAITEVVENQDDSVVKIVNF